MSAASARTVKTGPARFTIRSLIWSVYAPSFLLSFGQGILVPVLPVFVRDEFGVSAALVGLAVASRSIGMMGFDVPAGIFVSRLGLKRTMWIGVLIFGIAAVIAAYSPTFGVFVAARLLAGVSFALWSISRQVYIAQTVPMNSRGKALSLFGGVSRIAQVLGPLVGGVLYQYVSHQAPFMGQAVVAVVTLALVLYTFRGTIENLSGAGHNIFPVLGRTLSENRGIFATAGSAAIILQFMREGRNYIIPLWGDDIGLSGSEIGYITSVSFFIDATMFPIVGYVMDRWGRKFTGVPAFVLLAASLAVIPLSTSFGTLLLAGILAGLGNGMSSGFVLTMGTDFAPPDNTGEFLGVWRFISDSGGAGGPLAIGSTAQLFTLTFASFATAGLGIFGAIVLVTLVRETLVKRE